MRAISKRYGLHRRLEKMEAQSPGEFAIIFLPTRMWATPRIHRAAENFRVARNVDTYTEIVAGPLVNIRELAADSGLTVEQWRDALESDWRDAKLSAEDLEAARFEAGLPQTPN